MASTIEYITTRMLQSAAVVPTEQQRPPYVQRQLSGASNNTPDTLLDDDLVLDTRVYSRPAAIVEAKLNSRISSFQRYCD